MHLFDFILIISFKFWLFNKHVNCSVIYLCVFVLFMYHNKDVPEISEMELYMRRFYVFNLIQHSANKLLYQSDLFPDLKRFVFKIISTAILSLSLILVGQLSDKRMCT